MIEFENYKWPEFKDFWVTIVSAVVIGATDRICKIVLYPLFYKVSKVKEDENMRCQKALKASEQGFKILYFTVSLCTGYYVLA